MSNEPTHAALNDTAASSSAPNLSADYLERVKIIDELVHECIWVSQRCAGIKSLTAKHFYASVLFTSLLTKSVSMAILTPETKWSPTTIKHWDFGSIAGVVRSMLEIRLNLFYLCIEACSEEEWICRWNLFNLHDCMARRRMFEANVEERVEDLRGFDEQADELRERLKTNRFFLSLPSKQQQKLLKGRDAHLYALEDLAERSGVGRADFRFFYVFFSQQVHGLPMSYYRMGGDNPDRGRGVHSDVEEGYTSLCLMFAATLMVSARDEMLSLFSDLISL